MNKTISISPCEGSCKIDRVTELCLGCWRTIDEIINWRGMSDDQKREVYQLIDVRKAQHRG